MECFRGMKNAAKIMLLVGLLFKLAACSTTGGGKICFGYEETNRISNTSGYEIPKKEGK